MSTWYISPTGSDSNPGTQALPFLSIQKGVNATLAGDTVFVKNGTYTTNVGITNFPVNINSGLTAAGASGAWCTLQAESLNGVILDGKSACHSFIQFQSNSAYWRVIGFEIKNCYNGGIWCNSGGAKNVRLQHCHIHHIGNHTDTTTLGLCGIYTDNGADQLVIDGCSIHDVGRSNDAGNSYDHGIYIHGTNVTISNCLFWNALSGWHISTADGFTGNIVNNTFFGPNMYGSKAGQIMLWGNNTVVVRNNIFYNPRTAAVDSYAVTFGAGSTVDHNTVFNSSGAVAISTGLSIPTTPNQLNVDPLLVNPVPGGDYHLKAGSPAVGMGSTSLMPSIDFDGISRSGSNDTGAYRGGTAPVGITTKTTSVMSTPVTTVTAVDAKTTVVVTTATTTTTTTITTP